MIEKTNFQFGTTEQKLNALEIFFLEQIWLISDEKSEVKLYSTVVVETPNYVRCLHRNSCK